MKIRQVHCKTALSRSSLPGLDYSLNPYRGCQHRCTYCYVPSVLKLSREQWRNFVDVKINIPLVLSKEIKSKKPGMVGISTVTDPYQPIEKKYKLTRYCLEALLRYDFPVSIQTKSSLVIRDIDIVTKFSTAEVMMSIGTLNDKDRRLLEPYSTPINERLNVLKEYSKVGVKTCVFFGPIYPTVEKQDIQEVIDTYVKYGASEVMIDTLHVKPGIWGEIEKRIADENKSGKGFFENNWRNSQHYNQIRNEIMRIGRQRDIKIVDAF